MTMLKYDKKIWSNFVINWDPQTTIFAKNYFIKITSSCINHLWEILEILEAKSLKK